jgi:UDP-N-acetylmuramoyl-L-alanyl-D-glutamate--2,6-diaminopimelate ligase
MLPATAFALVNADDANSAVMLQNTKATKRSFAVKSMADHRARIIENQLTGLHLNIDGHDMYSRSDRRVQRQQSARYVHRGTLLELR